MVTILILFEKKLSLSQMGELLLKPGAAARIRKGIHSPYPGRCGTVLDVDRNDARGPYLISFNDGLQFRYHAHELRPLEAADDRGLIEILYRAISDASHDLLRGTNSR